jgi:O-antigen ligase
MTQALGGRALVQYPDARYEIEQEKRRRWVVYGAVALFAIVVALMAVASAPELFSIVFAVLVVVCVAAFLRPVVGLYSLVFLTLVGDIVTTPWWPFTKNMSSRESAFYIADGLTISPFEVVLITTLGAFFVRRLGDPTWRFKRGNVFTPLAVFTGFVVAGLFYGVFVMGGDTRAAVFEVRPLLYLPLIYILVTNLFETRVQYQRLLLLAFVAVSVQSVFALSYYRYLSETEKEALESLSEHSATIHMNAMFMFLLGLWLLRGRRWVLATVLVLTPTVFWAYLLSQRRAAMVALFLGIALLTVIVYHRRRRAFWWFTPTALVLGGIFVAGTWNAQGALGLPSTAVKSVIAPGQLSEKDQRSDLYRQVEAYDLWFTVRQKPLTGVGFGQKFYVPVKLPDISFFEFWQYLPHNAVLWIWLKVGFFGLVVLMYLFARSIQLGTRAALRVSPPDATATVTVGVLYLAMFLIYAFVDIAFDVRTTVFLAFCFALCADFESARSSPGQTWAQRALEPRRHELEPA